MSDFRLTSAQRHRLLAKDYAPLDFDTKPYRCDPGAKYVLQWQRARAELADDGHVLRQPRVPVWYIVVTKVMRHRKGFWRVLFDVHDLRDTDRYLRRTPPVMAPHSKGGPRESDYQWTRWGAVDELPAVPGWVQDEFSARAAERDEGLRLERSVQARATRFRRKRGRAA